MIEVLLLDYLKGQMDCDVGLSLDDVSKDKYIVLEKASDYPEEGLNHATFNIFIHDQTLFKTAVLSEILKEALISSQDEVDDISECDINYIRNYTDEVKKEPRYLCNVDFVFY